ncbi:P-II family nitrogen regulator [Evansella cellulosilytica]|nr:P-II family nitrogen regulator [Evansella cellulosilytica]
MKKVIQKHKLIITIVKKGFAKKVVGASKQAGAEGGTILLGRGTGVHENKSFLGIPIIPEKEIVLSLVRNNVEEKVIEAITKEAKLHQPGTGLGIVIHTKAVIGICHLLGLETSLDEVMEGDSNVMDTQKINYDLIVTIVNKGNSDKVVLASKKAGAEGGTIISGRGTGIHEQAKLLNIMIEPEKEAILTLIERNKTEAVLEKINDEAGLNKPGNGIAFVLDVQKTIGINHILNRQVNEHLSDNK